jgi:hypothetical protein
VSTKTYVDYMITTTDNPYNPFDEFDLWHAHDQYLGHHTMAFLARLTATSPYLSESDERLAINYAIDEMIKENVSGVYRRVEKEFEIDVED